MRDNLRYLFEANMMRLLVVFVILAIITMLKPVFTRHKHSDDTTTKKVSRPQQPSKQPKTNGKKANTVVATMNTATKAKINSDDSSASQKTHPINITKINKEVAKKLVLSEEEKALLKIARDREIDLYGTSDIPDPYQSPKPVLPPIDREHGMEQYHDVDFSYFNRRTTPKSLGLCH